MTPERKAMIAGLNEYIRRQGAWAVSWPNDRRLRFEAVSDTAERLAHDLQMRGHAVHSAGSGERFAYDHPGPIPTTVFQIILPPDRPSVPTGRQAAFGELADAEDRARRKRLGLRAH
jgi:hypothetical protein